MPYKNSEDKKKGVSMRKVIFTSGLPASGKTTFSKQFCEKNHDWVRVNRDDLRRMRGQYWIPKQEDLITQWEVSCIISALHRGYNVIVDATHLNNTHLATLKNKILEQHPATQFEIKFFRVSLEECIKRDLQREHSVGHKVITDMYNKYLRPVKEPIKQDWLSPHVIIVDLDGTVALHVGRSPFEYNKCYTDKLNIPVARIVSSFLHREGYRIVYMSGREDTCKLMTIEWLTSNQLWNYNCEIHMRKSGDYRKDSVIKEELFNEHVKDKYYVDFCLDDRNQIVELWRSLGLICLQVDEGNF